MSFWDTLGSAAGSAVAMGVINLFRDDKKTPSASKQALGSAGAGSSSFGDIARQSSSTRQTALAQSKYTPVKFDNSLKNVATFNMKNINTENVRQALVAQLIRNGAPSSQVQAVLASWNLSDQKLIEPRKDYSKIGFA